MQIGFVGLGIMGRPMAHNLMQAGTSCSSTASAPPPEIRDGAPCSTA
jgi:3-hydroxyisobutyrate dehydrogenase-like beta-hydroxyacid dehydrogenase